MSIPESSYFARTAWTIGSDTTAQTLSESAYWEDTTTTEYTNMVSSVNTHKGFYIGRYEVSRDSTSTIAQSKRGQAAWTGLSPTEASSACTKNTSTDNMHLMYGIEWDSTLNWLKNKATISSSMTMGLSDIQTNSNSWECDGMDSRKICFERFWLYPRWILCCRWSS